MPSILWCCAGRHLRLVDALHQHRQQDVAHERRLPDAATPGDGDEAAERDVDVDVARLCSRAVVHVELLEAGVRRMLRQRDRLRARQVLAGDRLLDLREARDRAAVDDVAAMLAGAWTDVDDPVALADGLFVVLDDDHRVSEIA